MAQYGRNFYGASYYGRRGIFGGQYTSEEISSGNPISGPLTATIVAALPKSTYPYNSAHFLYTTEPNTMEYNDDNYAVIESGNTVSISLIGSDFVLSYLKHTDGGIMDISIETYIDGDLVDTQIDTINLNGATASATYSSPQLQFGEQRITITHNVSSLGNLYISNIQLITADVSIEIRSRLDDGAFTAWYNVVLTREVVPEIDDEFTLTGLTPNYAGQNIYQFKILLGSSDDTTTPLVKSCGFTSGNSNNYSDNGQFRMRIDLGEGVASLGTVTYNGEIPAGTSVEIRTRTAGVEPLTNTSWTSWSAPYTESQKRVRMKSYNLLHSANPVSEYIITPLLNPQDGNTITLLSWVKFVAQQYVTDQNTKITYQVLDENLNRITYMDNLERYLTYISTANGMVEYRLVEARSTPIRIKAILTRNQGALSSPVIDVINYEADARYREFKEFNSTSGYKSYASAVYGNNTGIIDLTFGDTDVVGDGTLVAPSNLGFTLPTPIGSFSPISPYYSIETTSETFSRYRAGEELNLYWKSQTNNINRSIITQDPDDVIVAQAKAWPENNLSRSEARLLKHYQYGRGYVIYPNTVTVAMTNTFAAPLESDIKYSYYLTNGWASSGNISNENADIIVAWASNASSMITEVSEANGSLSNGILHNDSINISVSSGSISGEVPWVSEEKIFETVLNENGTYAEKIIEISGADLPQIDSNVSVGLNPYKVEVIYRSVQCNGKIVPEDRVISIDDQGNEYPRLYYTIDSFQPETIERSPILRHSSTVSDYIDTLPHLNIVSVLGIYRNDTGPLPDSPEDRPASYYVQNVDFTLVGNQIDWSIAYDENGQLLADRAAPAEGETYYVSYIYNRIDKVNISFRCRYKEYDTSKALWVADTTKEYSGSCSPGHDFKSDSLPAKTNEIEWGPIPQNVDHDTLFYTLYDDNIWVNTFISDNVVIGTLRDRVPSINWFPKVHNGYYYIGKDEYYLFTEPVEYTPDGHDVEKAINVQYIPGRYGNGIYIEEGTTNIILNSGFDKANSKAVVFSDSFTRTV